MTTVEELEAELRASPGALRELEILTELRRRGRISSTQKSKNRSISEIIESLEFPDELRHYQKVGAQFLTESLQTYDGVIIGDDPGLGKTAQVVATILANQALAFSPLRTIYVTKKTLITDTGKEINKWANGRLMVVPLENEPGVPTNHSSYKFMTNVFLNSELPSILVTNYESLNSFKKLLQPLTFDFLVVDEVHKLKGGAAPPGLRTKVWKNTKTLSKRCKKAIFMSGSPLNNSADELWAYLNIFDENKFDDYANFRSLFQDAETLELDIDKVIEILTPFMIMRSKRDVAPEIPELTHIEHTCKLTPQQKRCAEAAANELILFCEKMDIQEVPMAVIIEQLNRLRQINVYGGHVTGVKTIVDPITEAKVQIPFDVDFSDDGNGKLNATIELMLDLLAQDEQIVVYSSSFNDPLYYLQKVFKDTRSVATITGKTNNTAELVQKFQNKALDILLVNRTVGAEGLNLHKSPNWPGGASHLIILDRWWNPQQHEQMWSRIERINTTEPMFVHWMHAPGTVDDCLKSINNWKLDEANKWLDHTEFKVGVEDLKKMVG